MRRFVFRRGIPWIFSRRTLARNRLEVALFWITTGVLREETALTTWKFTRSNSCVMGI